MAVSAASQPQIAAVRKSQSSATVICGLYTEIRLAQLIAALRTIAPSSVIGDWAGSFRARCFAMPGRRASFKALAVLGSVFYMLLRSSEPLIASDDAASVDAKLTELKSATEITLLVVRYPTEFYRHVDKIRLRKVACVYQFASDRGPTFDKVFDVLSHADIQYDDRPRSADLRVGIIFRRFGEVLSEFYSDDWGGQFQVSGSWDGRQIVASADLPSLLRALPPGPRIPDDSICGVVGR